MPTGSVTPSGGGTTTAQVVASGKVLPVADATGVTVDTTTYDDPFATGKIAALIFPTDQAAFGFAQTGDAFPRFLWESDATLWGGDGTYDPAIAAHAGITFTSIGLLVGRVRGSAPVGTTDFVRMNAISPRFTITSGALSTVQLVSGTGVQILTTRDAETVTPCTFNPGAATTATVTVALSPDDVTYSTLAVVTEPAGVALDGTILPVKVRVPAGWYLKLTANAQAVLGLTTYY